MYVLYCVVPTLCVVWKGFFSVCHSTHEYIWIKGENYHTVKIERARDRALSTQHNALFAVCVIWCFLPLYVFFFLLICSVSFSPVLFRWVLLFFWLLFERFFLTSRFDPLQWIAEKKELLPVCRFGHFQFNEHRYHNRKQTVHKYFNIVYLFLFWYVELVVWCRYINSFYELFSTNANLIKKN